jgi:signal transduction histidine kinase
VSRNLITRLGTASGLVAALVAAVFLILTAAVRDQRSFDHRAARAEQVIAAATRGAGARGFTAHARTIVAAEEARVTHLRHEADSAATRAIALGIGGVIGSTALIALLTAYLANHIVVPLRRVNRAARVVAGGNLTERVPETGDAEARELARSFNAMAASLQESTRARDEFFALVSHELRTPLTSIIGYVDLVLEDEALGPDAQRFLEIVQRNGRRLLRLVGDMLFVAQMEAGRLSLHSEPVALRAVVVDSVDGARPAAESSSIGLELTLGAIDATDTVLGDHDRLAQALDNLISNALKFSARGAVVTVRAQRDAGHAVIEVIDTGDGIPAIEQEHLFDRFHRSSRAIEEGVPGAGLGLAVVKTIVEAHGGSVALRSAPGEGTTVRVELPILGEASVL